MNVNPDLYYRIIKPHYPLRYMPLKVILGVGRALQKIDGKFSKI
jgi:hypothetical protein